MHALIAQAVAFAQTSDTPAKPDLWGHLPGVLVIGVPLAIGLAVYISRRLGHESETDEQPRRIGAVSRALQREHGDDAS